MPRPQRPDGRPRGTHDKAYARLLFAAGVDPDDPNIRAKLTAKFAGGGLPAGLVHQMVEETIADVRWAKDGFPTI